MSATKMNDFFIGLDGITHTEMLPLLKPDVRVHYEGSIDKAGGNADWDWWLYQDANGEWVLLDVEGPGCICNFVQHRYPTSEEPVFRFYFDGEHEPRFVIRHSEFGEKYPFVEPLASRFIGPCDDGRGPIRVVRSFVPMPFCAGCRITSSVKLTGFDKAKGEGGWGHVIYHTYSYVPDTLQTFKPVRDYTGKRDAFTELFDQWRSVGVDPKKMPDRLSISQHDILLEPGRCVPILQAPGRGAVTSVLVRLDQSTSLENIWIHMTWDGHALHDVELPFSCLFGNELMIHKTTYLMNGYQPGGLCYCYFPMPYWRSAYIELVNRGERPAHLPWVGIRTAENDIYPEGQCAYFRAGYYPRKATIGSDSILADLSGRGHVVSAVITAHGSQPMEVACEGDVRVYIDGNATPQIESDGSESHSCYGWGFAAPPQTNPLSGYDGLPNSPWSMNRTCLGDWYPFGRSLRFGIESGGNNDQYIEHSGAVFYYGRDEESAVQTDEIDIGSAESAREHGYSAKGGRFGALESAYEGDDDHIMIADIGVYGASEMCFTLTVEPRNNGVLLRRRSDQWAGRQKAKVWVDGAPVNERYWYYADHNEIKRWLDDELSIPARFTAGKSSLSIRLVPEAVDGQITWNEFHYWVYSLL